MIKPFQTRAEAFSKDYSKLPRKHLVGFAPKIQTGDKYFQKKIGVFAGKLLEYSKARVVLSIQDLAQKEHKQ